MAASPSAISFDQIIQQGRDRKKAEKLASEIFGKGRRGSTPQLGARTKSTGSPSLASRINKPSQRSASSSSLNRTNLASAFERAARAQNGPRSTMLGATRPANGHLVKDFSIKGAAGPYVVVGSNFAPGTSAADIRSATESIVGEIQSCVIITSNPTVIAEMVFAEKAAAEMIIGTFNNQKADGRLLHLYLKHGPPTRLESPPPTVPLNTTLVKPRASNDKADLFQKRGQLPRQTSETIAEPEYQDGRYGFNSKTEEDVDMDSRAEEGDSRTEQRSDRFASDSRPDRRGYEQDYPAPRSPRSRGHTRGRPQTDRRPQYSERLYSDGMYSNSRPPRYTR